MNDIRLLLTQGFPGVGGTCFSAAVSVHPGRRLYISGNDNNALHQTFRHLIGECLCEVGTKMLDGHDISRLSPASLVPLGVASGSARLRVFPSLTMEEHFLIRSHATGQEGRKARWVDWARQSFSVLRAAPTTLCGNFSGGEQQSLMLALALMGSPRLVVIEEPWMGLADVARAETEAVVQELQGGGVSFVFLSQGAFDNAQADSVSEFGVQTIILRESSSQDPQDITAISTGTAEGTTSRDTFRRANGNRGESGRQALGQIFRHPFGRSDTMGRLT